MDQLVVNPSREIAPEEWEQVYNRIRFHTFRRHGPVGKRFGLDLEDIACHAVLDTMEGRRRWPPVDPITGEVKRNLSLFHFLCEVVKSEVSHRIEQEIRLISIDDCDPHNPKTPDDILAELSNTWPPFTISDAQSSAEYNHLIDTIRQLVDDDEELVNIIEAYRTEPDLKPRELVEKLGWTTNQIRAALRRLRRKLQALKKPTPGEETSHD